MSNFEKCLEIILHHEGGYVNHPKDQGGETNLGVTKRIIGIESKVMTCQTD